MSLSQDLSHYQEFPITELKAGFAITFPIYLYLSQNQRLIPWKARGEVLSAEFIERCVSKGVTRLWISKDDAQSFRDYLNPPAAEPEAGAEAEAEPVPPAPPAPKTEEGAKILEVMASTAMPEEQKQEEVAKEVQSVLSKSADVSTPEEQVQANLDTRRVLQDVLQEAVGKAGNLSAEIWKMAELDVDLDHGVNVGTYATLFAMAFGRIEPDLLADIALAGMLHDIGLTQVPLSVAARPLKHEGPLPKNDPYAPHVNASLELIQAFAPEINERVRTLIAQHHEKFDGTGYPNRLQGFHFNEIAQLVALADVMDSFVSGRWDGQRRTMKEALLTLEKLESSRTFPEYFNPEVFAAVLRWTQTKVDEETPDKAAHLVADQTNRLIRDKKKNSAA